MQKRRITKGLALLFVFAAIGFAGCSGGGDATTEDTTGDVTSTETATNTITGTFSEPGVDAGNISVALYKLQSTGGRTDIPLAQTYTNADGSYTLELIDSIDTSTGQYLVVAFGSELARNVTGSEAQDVNPITSAVSAYLDDLLELGADINALTSDFVASLLTSAAGCDPSAGDAAIRTCFLGVEAFATAIANAFTSTPTMQTQTNTTFDVIGAVPSFAYDLDVNDPDAATPTGFTFDMTDDCQVSDGYNGSNSDAFDDIGLLQITNGDTFGGNADFPVRADSDQNEARLEDVDKDGTADQIVYLATTDGGLNVTRKVYAPQTFDCTLGGTIEFTACGWARILDCIANPTGAAVTLDINQDGELGSDGDEMTVGNAFLDGLSKAFYWSTEEDGTDPQVGVVVDGVDGSVKADLVSFGGEYVNQSYMGQTIAAGGTACYHAIHRSRRS